MVKQSCLILIKPDGLVKSLTGNIITSLSEAKLKIIGTKIVSVKRELAEKHYNNLKEEKGEEIFEDVLKYIQGEYHTNRVLAMIYNGEDAIAKIREIAGATNPENAEATTIRGRYGRIHSKTGVFENVMHASDSEESTKREIQLWFSPDEIVGNIYPTETGKEEIEIKKWK
ncbi:MAG TPA: nucleoside-diphosphate kinase [Candidatus Pacearchaeota archaeon]|nr:nucleoside-diphosphate kinase [Candidatus Pacearchaeota archaeon]